MVGTERSRLSLIFEVIGITILAFLASLFLGFIFYLSLGVLGYDVETTFARVGATILGQIAFLGLAYIYIRLRDVTVPFDMPSRTDLKYVFGGTLLALTTAIVFSQILLYFDLMPESVIEEIAEIDPMFLIVLAILSVVLIAPAEELLFRGAVQGRLRSRYGPFPAITVASLLFGSFHLFNYTGDVLSIVMTTSLIVVLGGILGGLYERTQNLAVPILIHAIYNFILLAPSYFATV
ncbi:MAG: CPBP family intramembrane glutamic endopeptidase [Candidatus Natronoplasma sp.]